MDSSSRLHEEMMATQSRLRELGLGTWSAGEGELKGRRVLKELETRLATTVTCGESLLLTLEEQKIHLRL